MATTKKITVSVLSELTGVSRATVSRVLNNNSNVNESVRQKVLAAIEETGYQRSGSNPYGKVSKVTLVSDDATLLTNNHFYEPILQSLKQEASLAHLSLDFKISNRLKDPKSFHEFLGKPEAIILIGSDRLELINAICELQVPTVLLNATDPLMRLCSVLPDYEFGAFLLTNYLIKKGHRKIKLLTANVKHSVFQRTDGFLRALNLYHIPYTYEHNIIDVVTLADKVDPSGKLYHDIVEGRIGFDFGISHFYDYLIENDYFKDTSAVFCICDLAALGLIDKFKEHGIKVPEDLSVVGFDDLTISSIVEPPLTTINSNTEDLARLTFSLLSRILTENIKHPLRLCQEVKLMERNSVLDLTSKE